MTLNSNSLHETLKHYLQQRMVSIPHTLPTFLLGPGDRLFLFEIFRGFPQPLEANSGVLY
jgi:hypothetical protein